MRDVTLSVPRSDVLDGIMVETSFVGVKNADGNGEPIYDQVFLKEKDSDFLDGVFMKALNNLCVVLGSNLKSCISRDADEYVLTVRMPDNFPKEQDDTFNDIAYNFVLNQLLAEWFELTDKEKAETYASQAKALLIQVNQMLYMRGRPTRNFN